MRWLTHSDSRSNRSRWFARSPWVTPTQRLMLLVLLFLLTSCASNTAEIWRQVPIQMARVTQTESYSQTFLISTSEIKREEDRAEKDKLLDARMDRIFTTMIGTGNWQHLKNLYGISSIRNELMNRQIHMDGLLNFVVYLDPNDIRYIVIEGTGRYFAIRDATDAILMSGDFHITPQRYSLKSLERGCIPLDINLYISQIPGKTTYYKEMNVRYNLLINKVKKSKNAYTINYDRDHLAYLDMNNDDIYDPDDELIAAMKLNSRYQHVKLFDLSGLLFVKKDYRISEQAELEATIVGKQQQERQCVRPSSN